MKTFLVLMGAIVLAGCAAKQHTAIGGAGAGFERTAGQGAAPMAAEDASFLREAYQTVATEIDLGRLAARNTQNGAVRRFARHLVDEHGRAERELDRILMRRGMPIDTALARPVHSCVDRLAQFQNGAFDEAFKQQVVDDHERAIALFEEQAQQGADPALQSFARQQLPQLCEHLTTARWLELKTPAIVGLGRK